MRRIELDHPLVVADPAGAEDALLPHARPAAHLHGVELAPDGPRAGIGQQVENSLRRGVRMCALVDLLHRTPDQLTETTLKRRSPRGVCTTATSPARRPRSAPATGESIDSLPSPGDASREETRV